MQSFGGKAYVRMFALEDVDDIKRTKTQSESLKDKKWRGNSPGHLNSVAKCKGYGDLDRRGQMTLQPCAAA